MPTGTEVTADSTNKRLKVKKSGKVGLYTAEASKKSDGSNRAESSVSLRPPKFVIEEVSSSEEEDQVPEDATITYTKLKKENAMLRGQLAQAKGKFIMMVTAIKRVYSVINSLIKRTIEAQKLFKILIKLGKLLDTSQKEVTEKRDDIEKMIIFSKKNRKIVRNLVKSAEDIIEEFHECFLTLSDRIFLHDKEEPLIEFKL